MFSKILVANRGEIAVRVIRACQEMGIKTVAIYSDVDKDLPHVQLADEAVALGPPSPAESYLNISKILKIAEETGAEAIHPGYGFLSENPDFAEECEKRGIVFIGPPSEVIAKMGSKIFAKSLMEKSGVPVIPGYHGEEQDMDFLIKKGEEIGFPLLVKASAGGGGKGMRIVHQKKFLKGAIEAAKRESLSSFGDDTVFLEKYLEEPRHIEFQILADNYGHTIHLFERECSIQRRHQKIIEETPSPALTPEIREKMGEAAVRAAKAVGYRNAGTVEFMFSKGKFYFMEMNTRLQVEHPITEAVTGIDLVKWQIRIAAGERLSLRQEDLTQRGHAIECRIYAEDPEKNFMPCTGKITSISLPFGTNVRHDIGIENGNEITSYYDPMISKLIVHGENREDAIEKMLWALSNYVALGVTTNISFLKAVLQHPEFRKGNISTHFIQNHMREWKLTKDSLPLEVLVAAALHDMIGERAEGEAAGGSEMLSFGDVHSPWKTLGKWRIAEHKKEGN